MKTKELIWELTLLKHRSVKDISHYIDVLIKKIENGLNGGENNG